MRLYEKERRLKDEILMLLLLAIMASGWYVTSLTTGWLTFIVAIMLFACLLVGTIVLWYFLGFGDWRKDITEAVLFTNAQDKKNE